PLWDAPQADGYNLQFAASLLSDFINGHTSTDGYNLQFAASLLSDDFINGHTSTDGYNLQFAASLLSDDFIMIISLRTVMGLLVLYVVVMVLVFLALHPLLPTTSLFLAPGLTASSFPTSCLSPNFPMGVKKSQTAPMTRKTSGPAEQKTRVGTVVFGTVQTRAEYPKIICVTFRARLGNQLFQYASVLGLALRLHRAAVYSPSPLLASVLQYPPPAASAQQWERCQTARVLREKGCCHFQKVFLQLDPRKDYHVGKHLQSWKYFEGVEAEVRRAVLFKESVLGQAKRTVEELRRRCNQTLIGVHVRRGDFLKPFYVRRGFRTAPPEYYLTAMDYMRQRFRNVTFLVSVDKTDWFVQNVTRAKDVTILKRQNSVVDMALLASLDHVIISSGTYSWWVGYLNQGVTLYWKDFIANGTPLGNSFNPRGTTYIYPGWIPF
ncbi:galactoside alpha-(1,2)-fucosyltransferase 2-like, partial [Babylonia areolata]|uniref:galactoside alpha-(1,2)-fucosyltransferase 2-like n=1 Tax=Babylonia areolata TaxID=304850 RepID=UPI003FD463EC